MNYEFSYLAPRSQDDLLEMLTSRNGRARILAGGTDLLVNIRAGLAKPEAVIDLKRVPGHDAVEYDDAKGLSVGPAVTISQLMEHAAVREKYPALVVAAETLASHQLRNRATVIGNLCNASPCADMAPPLLCLGARVHLRSKAGAREMPLAEFFTGVKRTRIRPDEYFERLVVPAAMAGAKAGFRKLKRVKGHDLAVVSVCLVKRKGQLRVAVGSAAPTPVFCGEFKSSTPVAKLVRAASKAVNPIDDVRGSAEYRLFMIEAYLRGLVKEVR